MNTIVFIYEQFNPLFNDSNTQYGSAFEATIETNEYANTQ